MLENPLLLDGWVNGNLYELTTETIGILAVPESLRHDYNMAKFDDELADKNQKHRYLAQMQGTWKAILPVHTAAEIALFQRLMEQNEAFNSRISGPRWSDAVRVWNKEADTTDDIFYKVD